MNPILVCNPRLLRPISSTGFYSHTWKRSVMTISSALQLLGLSSSPPPHHHHENTSSFSWTWMEIRNAYYQRAKECHPDSNRHNSKRENVNQITVTKDHSSMHHECTTQFLLITEAYELLQKQYIQQQRNDRSSTSPFYNIETDPSEEQHYREACLQCLGLSAEIVEESKNCPIFREWLKGKSDAALHWNSFFMLHGGLSPRLSGVRFPKTVNETASGTSTELRRRVRNR